MQTHGTMEPVLYAAKHHRSWDLFPLEGTDDFFLMERFALDHPNANGRAIELRHRLGLGYTMYIYRPQRVDTHEFDHGYNYHHIITAITRENMDILWDEAEVERREQEISNAV
jgi:hypothetical protein